MESVSSRFLAEIRKSHTTYTYVEVISPTQQTRRLPVITGSVSVDRSAATRRSSTLVCIDPLGDLAPAGQSSILTPYGTEVRPYRGVRYDDGTTETVLLGVFRLAKASVADNVSGAPTQITLESFDKSRVVTRNKFLSPYTVAIGTNIVTAIKAILALTFPDLDYDTVSTSITLASANLYDVGSDPWQAVTDLATSIGCEIFFNAKGTCVIAPPVDISALPSPSFTFNEGNGCTLLDLTRIFTDEPGFNGVVVTGESAGDTLPPVRAVVWDTEPTSATYYLGPYGQVPMFITDQNVTTVADATAEAVAMLSQQLGFSSELTLTATVNPALDVGDVIQVTRARTHVSGLFVVDAISIPFESQSTQAITLRQKRTVG